MVEDFGERIKMGKDFDPRKEIKYVDYLWGFNQARFGKLFEMGERRSIGK